MMRDKTVFSVTGKLQELLLQEDKLDLQKCIKICRAFEQSNKHVQEIRDAHENTVHKINRIKLSIQMKETRNSNTFWEPDLKQIMKGKDFQ